MDLPSFKVLYFGNFNCRQAGIIIVAHQIQLVGRALNDAMIEITAPAIPIGTKRVSRTAPPALERTES